MLQFIDVIHSVRPYKTLWAGIYVLTLKVVTLDGIKDLSSDLVFISIQGTKARCECWLENSSFELGSLPGIAAMTRVDVLAAKE